jgi:two-component system sensor kinase FixL
VFVGQSHEALLALQLEAARWEAILETARDAIISIDPTGRITLFNRAAEEVFGYQASEVLGQNVALLMPSPYQEEHDRYIRQYQQTGTPRAIGRIRHVQARRKNGEVFPTELSVSEARVGNEVIYSAVLRDVSERHAMQAALTAAGHKARERERLADVGAITARIVHDLGNPLAGLAMQAQRILRRANADENAPLSTVRDSAERIVSSVYRLDALVREFLDFAREQRLDLTTVQLPHLLGEMASHWQPVATERRVTLALDVPALVPPLRADEAKLHRVFDNLIKNALEAIGRGPGHVKIAVLVPIPEKIVVSVEDTGPGIPSTLKVFKLFETTKPNGTGLGLAIAKQIVDAHGGGIEFASRQPNGTIFRIELPCRGPTV